MLFGGRKTGSKAGRFRHERLDIPLYGLVLSCTSFLLNCGSFLGVEQLLLHGLDVLSSTVDLLEMPAFCDAEPLFLASTFL